MSATRLNYFMATYDILKEEQVGFRKGMSTSNSTLKLLHAIKAGLNLKKSTLAVFIDFQGAYDIICRKGLLNKLKKIGVKDKMLNWMKRYLTQRCVRVRWNNVESKYRLSNVGLPQGSFSSPSFLNIYVNDLIKRLKKL
ncbi:uncharacterized protein CEXT_119001 [Caerostris extrusa]|uniref:Reverse transcriptase domain-containing protein n=1 Tax=Caerostris extrusa TaxID=172846 RepID=A0AAV4XJE9_CAEEX|nr:uncharacterized protein CEXT_119001 [Caerostris extrusa]